MSPASFQDFGIAYGGGIAQNLRAAPWKLALVPAFMAAYARAARRAARDADLVHAHWIPSAIAARATGKPYVLQVWGTDVELARRAPALFRPLLRGARLVIAASTFLADEARELGAREVRVVPFGVPIPDEVAPPDDPPHVLFAGRLSEEKGILEFLEATEGLERVIVGDGPLRAQVPEAVGFVPPSEIGAWYERAAVVCVPSRREGYGMGAREAMAFGRPVVATRVGGLRDLEHVAFVPPHDAAALRSAVERLLGDPARRAELGERARAEARGFSHAAAAERLAAAYRAAALPADRCRSRSTEVPSNEGLRASADKAAEAFTTCCQTDGRYGGRGGQGARTAVDFYEEARRCSHARSRSARCSPSLLGTATRRSVDQGDGARVGDEPRPGRRRQPVLPGDADRPVHRVGRGERQGARDQPGRQRELPRCRSRTRSSRCCTATASPCCRSTRARTRGAGLVGWTYPDEPDNNGWTPASLGEGPSVRARERRRARDLRDHDRPVLPPGAVGSTQIPLSRYAGFARLADMAGFDLYPAERLPVAI